MWYNSKITPCIFQHKPYLWCLEPKLPKCTISCQNDKFASKSSGSYCRGHSRDCYVLD